MTRRNFLFPRIHGPDHDLCIRSIKNTFIKRNFVIFNVFAVLFCTVEGWRRMTIILTDSILSSAKISRFVYSTHCPSDACPDKCPLCYCRFEFRKQTAHSQQPIHSRNFSQNMKKQTGKKEKKDKQCTRGCCVGS